MNIINSIMESIDSEKVSCDVRELVNIVMRQTDYDAETSLSKLQINDYDPLIVIREYMNPSKENLNRDKKKLTTNQLVYKEIRTMLDCAEKARRDKE
uniref:Uncharacterized protein n=1 Tax=viral metagenome TaxID=1070528 RepID=A0A6C0BXF3_9ZZZZ